jgi:hypothetical protein
MVILRELFKMMVQFASDLVENIFDKHSVYCCELICLDRAEK